MFHFIDLIILMVIAVFIFSRLYNILGQVDEESEKNRKNSFLNFMQKKSTDYNNKNNREDQESLIDIHEASLTEDIRLKIKEIKKVEPEFALDNFLQGVKKAFAMIVSALNNRNKEILSHLLTQDLYEKTLQRFNELDAKQEVENRNILNIRDIDIKSINIFNDKVEIQVAIQNNQTYVLRDKLGNILNGSDDKIVTSLDSWKFSKTLNKDKIWFLKEI